jgi:GT2 family glycosyltransferase
MTLDTDIEKAGVNTPVLDAPDDLASVDDAFQGYVDLFGYHCLAGGWFFAGWATRRAGLAESLGKAVAMFDEPLISATISTLFFSRDDISAQAVGFLIFLRAPSATKAAFKRLKIEIDGATRSLNPVDQAAMLPESKLIPRLKFIVSLSEASLERRDMELLLDGHPDATGSGYVEYFGYHAQARGWFISGWMSRAWVEGQTPDRVVLSFEDGDVRGELTAAAFARPELPEDAQGVILFIRAEPSALGPFQSASLHVGGVRTTMAPIVSLPQLREAELTARLRANLAASKVDLYRDRLSNLLSRRPYSGEDTLDGLAPAIFLYVDEAIVCGPNGLVLMGWMLAKSNEIREIRVRSGTKTSVLQMQNAIKIDRQDVLDEFAKHGFDDSACGFIAFVPAAIEPDGKLYLEVETIRYETGFRNIPRPTRNGMSAIRHLLGAVDVRFGDMRNAFDRVLGPAVEALNRSRLATPPTYQILDYGAVPAKPRYSVIVPLYGRLDFVEYQLALFSAWPKAAEVEYIYVLDDPPKRREAQVLFASIYERFLIPFRAILLDRNLGFAPANNVGLRHAKGEFVAYLNSDVFPGTPDWLERLSDQLVDDPKLGVVGPLLLFEDGSVQHRGMYFERLPEYGDWYFCQHHDKGLRYTGGHDLQHFISITGACMVLRRDLAEKIGGFNETYVIGDFEDSDLCLALQKENYQCAIDPEVRLYHLERKSQQSGAVMWRANLTAYNAWQHERRWSGTITEKQGIAFGGRT